MRIPIILLLLIHCFAVSAQTHVSYCTKISEELIPENVSRVFLDFKGDLYPKRNLDEKLFFDVGSNVRSCLDSLEGMRSDSEWGVFQKSIATQLTDEVKEQKLAGQRVYVIVHGFRKPAFAINGDKCARDEYDILRKQVNEATGRENYFIEVYWDGMYMKAEKSLKFVTQLGKMFKKQAKGNAAAAGVGLRRLVSALEEEELTVISHSLGAEVVSNLLFNSRESDSLSTPKQNLEICMVAPAISKSDLKNYYERSEDSHFIDSDNYQLTIIYNEEDFVLSKSSRILGVKISLSRRYGNTRLGCNCGNEAEELVEYFEKNFPASLINLVHADSFGSSHHAQDYYTSMELINYLKTLD